MPISRRRLLIAAAAAPAALSCRALAAAELPLRRWRGVVMGAEAEILLATDDAGRADDLVQDCLAEARRLERVYSLYRPDSALVRLNRQGQLADPPPELLDVLSASRSLWQASGGVFDPSVQPLWQLYADWYSRPQPDPAGPPAEVVRRVLDRVGFEAVEIAASAIRFTRPGMALTLNGIAQGHVTDRIAELLRSQGLTHVLVAFGEVRALGSRPDGSPWRVGLEAPGFAGPLARLSLADRAVATSAGAAGPFGDGSLHNHIFDPRTGMSPRLHAAVSVVAPSAMLADGLSTAISVLPLDKARALVVGHVATEAYVIAQGGDVIHLVGAPPAGQRGEGQRAG